MRADRLLSLLLLLQDRGKVKADELAARLEVTPRAHPSRRRGARDRRRYRLRGARSRGRDRPAGRLPHPGDGPLARRGRGPVAAGVPRVLSEIGLGRALRTGLVKLGASLPDLQGLAGEHLRRRTPRGSGPVVPRTGGGRPAGGRPPGRPRGPRAAPALSGAGRGALRRHGQGLVAKAESWYPARLRRRLVRLADDLRARYGPAPHGERRVPAAGLSSGAGPRSVPRGSRGGPAGTTPRGPRRSGAARPSRR